MERSFWRRAERRGRAGGTGFARRDASYLLVLKGHRSALPGCYFQEARRTRMSCRIMQVSKNVIKQIPRPISRALHMKIFRAQSVCLLSLAA